MYHNRRDPTTHGPSHDPPPTRERKWAEEEITSRTHLILHELRRKLGRTQFQTSLDKYIAVVGPRFAFDKMGLNRIPFVWRPGVPSFVENWWYTLQIQTVARLVCTYFDAIREGDIPPWDAAIARLREMLEVGIHEYKLAPVEPTGFTLMTQKEWEIEKQRRLDVEQEKADKLSGKS